MKFASRQSVILELGFRPDAIPLLERYVDLLWKSNQELNLFSRKMSFTELIENHVIDCLLPLEHFPGQRVRGVADFGSGGGLPGVIYALQFPELHFQLFEKSPLKRAFLAKCAELAPNIIVKAEIPERLENVDLIVARAFKPIDVILQVSHAFCRQGGQYFLLKGRREKIEEELSDSRKREKNLVVQIDALRSPVLDVERHLVRIN